MGGYKKYLIFLGITVISACVEKYVPDRDDLSTGTLVVQADLTDRPGEQVITLSRSSTLITPVKKMESGCLVELVSGSGDSRDFTERSRGVYVADPGNGFLERGEAYFLRILTSTGELYESGYETLYPSTAIDSFYYELESLPGGEEENLVEGIRFYIDFEMDRDSAPYLKWSLEETYEFRNPSYEAYIYDYERRIKPLPDSSHWLTCWISDVIPDIYTFSLKSTAGEQYHHKPLHFVSNEPQRLHHRYSVRVIQYSLSEEAYYYWNELRKNFQQAGGLFGKQPSLTPGNISNTEDPGERVLGYFSISGASEKRIFVQDVEGLDLIENDMYCFPSNTSPLSLRYLRNSELPVYFSEAYLDGERYFAPVNKQCVDCREYTGSSHVPPDFW